MKSSDIKQCPFCGGYPDFRAFESSFVDAGSEEGVIAVAECMHCGVHMINDERFDEMEDAIIHLMDKWNKRI